MMSPCRSVPARRSALAASSPSTCRNEAPPCPAGGVGCRRTAAHESYRSICRSASTRDIDGDGGRAYIEGEHTALTDESPGSRNTLGALSSPAGGTHPTVALDPRVWNFRFSGRQHERCSNARPSVTSFPAHDPLMSTFELVVVQRFAVAASHDQHPCSRIGHHR